ncbi:MAG: PadR family transcriptional regulator [Gemmatimonadota bacterium]|nr:PadR family transcriptional regulator [Gemmatimonadota bacterium]
MSSDAPLGSFEEQVLLAVVRTGGDAYGMRVRHEIERITERDVTIGAVYATLDRMESKGLVLSRRADVDGMSRRLFAISPRGARALAETRLLRDRLWEGVDFWGLAALGQG